MSSIWPSWRLSRRCRGCSWSCATGSEEESDDRNRLAQSGADCRTSRLPVCRTFKAGVVSMTGPAWLQLVLFLAVLLGLVKVLGTYMARVYQGQRCGLDR